MFSKCASALICNSKLVKKKLNQHQKKTPHTHTYTIQFASASEEGNSIKVANGLPQKQTMRRDFVFMVADFGKEQLEKPTHGCEWLFER